MTGIHILIAAGALTLAYLYLAYRLRKFAHPLRMELFDAGEAIMDNCDIPEAVKESVNFALLNSRSVWVAVVFLALYPVFSLLPRKSGDAQRYRDLPPGMRREIRDFFGKAVFCMVANSPVTALVFSVEFFVLGILFASRDGVFRALEETRAIRAWGERRVVHG